MKEQAIELIRDYLDGRISEENLHLLEAILESDAEAREEFRAMAAFEEGLRDFSASSDVLFPHIHTGSNDGSLAAPSTWPWAHPLGTTMLVLGCIGILIAYWRAQGQVDSWGDSIARIEFVSNGARFSAENQLATAEGSLLNKGWLQLDSGSVRLLFRSGATLEGEGPLALGIDTPMRAFLESGKVSVHAPDSARDFVIATESMEVVDLGTRFEVAVDPESREANVSVTEGLVDLHLGSRGAERSIRPLAAGFSARVDAIGEIVEITGGEQTTTKPELSEPRLFGHWTFDDDRADPVVRDSLGQRDGILNGADQYRTVAGVSGNAMAFDGAEAHVDLSKHIEAFSRCKDFTFSARVRVPEHRLAILFSIAGESEQHRVQVYLTRRFLRFGWQDGLHFDSISGKIAAWQPDRWYHVAVTVGEQVASLYVDGELVGSGAAGAKIGTPVSSLSSVVDPVHAYLGRLEDGRQGAETAAQWFKGEIDDVQIYSGALSQDAVQFVFDHPGKVWSARSD